MAGLSALEISRRATLKPVTKIAAEAGIPEGLLEPYGEYVAKVSLDAIEALADRPRARYVVVTAITPTPLGEGKTTTTLGLGQAMRHISKRATIAIRQASMGPTFGIKGGAAGGGYSQAVPFEALNLHLTGDMHAVTAAHNLLSAMLDNHLHHGQRARDRPPQRDVASGARRQRPGAAQSGGRPRHRGGRGPPAVRVRHHRRVRGHGGARPVDVAAGHAPPPGTHRRRLHSRAASR